MAKDTIANIIAHAIADPITRRSIQSALSAQASLTENQASGWADRMNLQPRSKRNRLMMDQLGTLLKPVEGDTSSGDFLQR